MLYYCDRTSFHYVSNITVCLHDQLFIKNISGRISQNVQTTRSRVTHSIYRIKSNLINTDKDISSSRSCLLSASKFIAKTQHRLSHSLAPPHQHSSWTTTSKRRAHLFHQHSSHTNRTSRDSSEQPFLRLHQSPFNEQHHRQHINSSQTKARTSI